MDKYKRDMLRTLEEFIVFFAILFLFFQTIFGVARVDGQSMNNTLHNGQAVIYTRLVKEYKKGDVISVKMPSGEYYIKRVIATEGDTIDIQFGKMIINGQELNENYALGETQRQFGMMEYPYTLQENELFILGDNREASTDSRTFGPIITDQIKGRIWNFFLDEN